MTRKFGILMLGIILGTFLFQSSCSTAEECEFNLMGTWQITVTFYGSITWYFTFTGTATEGTVSGFSYPDPVLGTYTVSNCTSVNFIFDYYENGYHLVWTFSGTLHNEDSMSGTINIDVNNGDEVHIGSWIAIRL